MREAILKVDNIHKSFGDVDVLKGISFEIHEGEKIAILGPSGSGKSTVLRCINRLETYDDGEIIYRGTPVNNVLRLHELRQNIGMVFQKFNVFTHMTVLQNIIEAPIHVKKISKEAAKSNARELLDLVGLTDKENVCARNLSGGQQQRVAMARAMAMNPDVILFDEPTSALDPELVGEVLNVIRKVADEGVAMVIVTHEMEFAREVADRIIFMDEGVVLEDTTPYEFFENPKNDRIKQFIRKIEYKEA